MSDPAVEAAERAAVTAEYTGRGLVIAAAREALAPIRGEIEELRDFYYGNTREDVEARIVLDRIAKLVYPTEELEARDE